jgi:hypothetical protein
MRASNRDDYSQECLDHLDREIKKGDIAMRAEEREKESILTDKKMRYIALKTKVDDDDDDDDDYDDGDGANDDDDDDGDDGDANNTGNGGDNADNDGATGGDGNAGVDHVGNAHCDDRNAGSADGDKLDDAGGGDKADGGNTGAKTDGDVVDNTDGRLLSKNNKRQGKPQTRTKSSSSTASSSASDDKKRQKLRHNIIVTENVNIIVTEKVSVRRSKIKDGGMGAFCERRILQGEVLGYYEVCVYVLNYIYKINQ